MSSRRPARQILVAVLLGVLVGGGLMAVTPAGAQVSQSVATSWKKIWKKNLRPLADKRYYTKVQSDAKYQPKGAYEAAGSGWTKAESDAKYAGAGTSYSKAESDAKYAPSAPVLRGSFMLLATGGGYSTVPISLGQGFATAPTMRYVSLGEALPTGCSGSAAAPNAAPGYLCVFESYNFGSIAVSTCRSVPSVTCGAEYADQFGTTLYANSGGSTIEVNGTWAARPAAIAAPTLPFREPSPSSVTDGPPAVATN
jgi:hypothetical protein